MKKVISSLLIVGVALFVSACSSNKTLPAKENKQMQKPKAELKETYWQLTSFAMLRMAVSGKSHIILKKDGRVTGSGSCNRLMSSYTQDTENQIHFAPSASTMMACPNMKEEQRFLQSLGKVDSYKITGERLELFEKDKLSLVFKAVYLH